jgi:hypothetical protein
LEEMVGEFPKQTNHTADLHTTPEPPELTAKLASEPDRTPLIVNATLEDPAADPVSSATFCGFFWPFWVLRPAI